MYRRILLTHDGSELADQAVTHAGALAKATGAEVVVLQIVDSVSQIMAQMAPVSMEPMSAGPATVDIAEESVSSQHQEADQNLAAVRATLEAAGAPKVTVVVAEGRPQDAIVEAAEQLGCDLVVMATHGRSGLGRVLLGSVADHVVRNTANAAVLLIRPSEPDAKRD